MRGKRIIFLFALLMAAAGTWAQDYHQWESGGCMLTLDGNTGKMTVSKKKNGNGIMDDYGTYTFRLNNYYAQWNKAYVYAEDKDGHRLTEDLASTAAKIIDEGYGLTQFVINVTEGAVKIIV